MKPGGRSDELDKFKKSEKECSLLGIMFRLIYRGDPESGRDSAACGGVNGELACQRFYSRGVSPYSLPGGRERASAPEEFPASHFCYGTVPSANDCKKVPIEGKVFGVYYVYYIKGLWNPEKAPAAAGCEWRTRPAAARNGMKGDNTMMNEQKRNMKHTGGKQVLCRILAALAVLALLVGIVLPGLGEEAEKPAEATELPDYCLHWMNDLELTGKLVPVNLSCEAEGIRAELLYAAVNEQEAEFVYSFQDLEGDRINMNGIPCVPSFVPGETRGHYTTVKYDEAEDKYIFAGYVQYSNPEGFPNSTLSFRAANIEVYRKSELYITGMLRKYGEKARLVEMPEILDRYYKNYDEDNPVFYTAEDYRNEGVQVLDYKNPLSVRLHKNLDLSGIGVVDGKLHVQLHYSNEAFRTYPSSRNSIHMVDVSLINNGEYVDNYSWLGSVTWSLYDNGMPDFEEHIFPWDIKEGDHPAIKVEITEVADIINGNWKIDVPLESVWVGEGPCPYAPAGSTDVRELNVTAVFSSEPAVFETPAADADGINPDYLTVLSSFSPNCLKDPVPVSLSCENEGIRLEVLAASVKENAALFFYSLQDLEGDRVTDEIHPFIEIGRHEDFSYEAWTDVDENRSTGVRTFAAEYQYDSPDAILDGGQITAGLSGMEVARRSRISILELLEKYRDSAVLVDLPELIPQYYGDSEENIKMYGTAYYRDLGMKVLDYTNPLSVPLHKNLELSGIGVVDGQLHVQLHYLDNGFIECGNYQFIPVSGVTVSCEFSGPPVPEAGFQTVSMEWDTDYDGQADFIEYVIPFHENAKVWDVAVEFRELTDIVDGNWKIEIPLESVWTGDPAYLENK